MAEGAKFTRKLPKHGSSHAFPISYHRRSRRAPQLSPHSCQKAVRFGATSGQIRPACGRCGPIWAMLCPKFREVGQCVAHIEQIWSNVVSNVGQHLANMSEFGHVLGGATKIATFGSSCWPASPKFERHLIHIDQIWAESGYMSTQIDEIGRHKCSCWSNSTKLGRTVSEFGQVWHASARSGRIANCRPTFEQGADGRGNCGARRG